MNGPNLRERLARALQGAAIGWADDLVLGMLEEELSATSWAKRLAAIAPNRLLATADVPVRGAQLLDRRPARARGNEHLAEAMTAQIAIKLSSKGHYREISTPITCAIDPLFQYHARGLRVLVSLDTHPDRQWLRLRGLAGQVLRRSLVSSPRPSARRGIRSRAGR